MMQQSVPVGPDLSSPYLLWQYVQFMTPPKTSDYTIHQAFTQPATTYPPHHVGYAPQQYITNYNYRLQHQQPRPVYPTSHTNNPLLDDQKSSSDIMCKKNNLTLKRTGRFRTDRAASGSLNQLRSAQSSLTSRNSSPAKGSTFTIDAILNKTDKNKSPMDISSKSDPHPHKIYDPVDSCCTTPFRSEPMSPTRAPPCSPTTARFVQPLMHSTPAHERGGLERRNNRLYELNHPYMFHPYDNTYLPHHPHGVPHTPLTSSLSSLSSLSSGSSSISTSPEANSTQHKDKTERKCGGKPKRIRTIFTPEQLEKLEAEFERQQYMVGTERYYLAATLNLTEAQVKVWFQNRRIKWRKQHLEQQQARLAQSDLYKDMDEESDDTDNEERTGSDMAENESKMKSDISDETNYTSS